MKKLKNKFLYFYEKQMFFPGFFAIFLNPFYFARKGLARQIKDFAYGLTGTILDIGCGTKPYKDLFRSTWYFGIEIPNEKGQGNKAVDVLYDGCNLPFKSNSIDSVIASQVFEHVFQPNEFLHEINRVLQPGGQFLISTPFIWDEHEQPIDYARYSSFGLRYLLEQSGFEVISERRSIADIRAVLQLFNMFIYKTTFHKKSLLKKSAAMCFMVPINVVGEVLKFITPINPDLYLDNVVLAKKKG